MAALQTHILCIEDPAATSAMYRLVLESAGYRFDAAAHAPDAMALIETHHYDLFIMDHRLNGPATGVDLCPWIRARDARTPLLLVSGTGCPGERQEALAAGANAYLMKPLDPQQLLSGAQDRVGTTPVPGS